MEYLVVRKTDCAFFMTAHSIKIKSLSNERNNAEIMTLLRKLKKDTNWLLNFILESKEKSVAASVNTQMTAGELLAKC
jgi:3'-phosphoadenosine 5'-phosphosulfate sulfotransferase